MGLPWRGHAVRPVASWPPLLVATTAYSDKLARSSSQKALGSAAFSFQIATEPLPSEFDFILLRGRRSRQPHALSSIIDAVRWATGARRTRVDLGAPTRAGLGAFGAGNASSLSDARQASHRAPVVRARCLATSDHLPHLHEPETGFLVMAAGCQARHRLMVALGELLARYLEVAILPSNT